MYMRRSGRRFLFYSFLISHSLSMGTSRHQESLDVLPRGASLLCQGYAFELLDLVKVAIIGNNFLRSVDDGSCGVDGVSRFKIV